MKICKRFLAMYFVNVRMAAAGVEDDVIFQIRSEIANAQAVFTRLLLSTKPELTSLNDFSSMGMSFRRPTDWCTRNESIRAEVAISLVSFAIDWANRFAISVERCGSVVGKAASTRIIATRVSTERSTYKLQNRG